MSAPPLFRLVDERRVSVVRDAAAVRTVLGEDPVGSCMVASRVAEHGIEPSAIGGELWTRRRVSESLCYAGANLIPLRGDLTDLLLQSHEREPDTLHLIVAQRAALHTPNRLALEHLPKELKHLAWLSLDDADGQEYWAAMNLMGRYAAANHALIHKHIAKKLGAHVILDIENHHNFAWKETHVVNGEAREVIVHRKGATPAGAGVLGIIPGSMASPGYVVRGKGSPESLTSASHGAGRVMSRTKAMQSFTWSATKKLLAERGVELLSAGLDEVPGVYKDIHAVMAAQTDLVEVLGQFDPKLVKMCPAGDRAED